MARSSWGEKFGHGPAFAHLPDRLLAEDRVAGIQDDVVGVFNSRYSDAVS